MKSPEIPFLIIAIVASMVLSHWFDSEQDKKIQALQSQLDSLSTAVARQDTLIWELQFEREIEDMSLRVR